MLKVVFQELPIAKSLLGELRREVNLRVCLLNKALGLWGRPTS